MPHRKRKPTTKKKGGRKAWMKLVMAEYRKSPKAGLAAAMKRAKKKRGR